MNPRWQFIVPTGSISIFLCFFLIGCGGGQSKVRVYPVRGEVFFNGEPATGAEVHFHPVDLSSPPAMATVDDDGAFELSTYSTSDGAAVGDYIVTVNWRDERPGDGEIIVGPDRLGERYSKRDVSKLTAIVSEGENLLDRYDLKGK